MGLDKQQSTLVIKTSADHSILGDYRCRVSNREAADSVLIGVAAAAIPATPTHLYSVNVSHSTVTLMWRPAFNGGRTQQFLIRFKSSGDGNYRYIEDVSGELASTTIANLQQDTKYHFWIAAKNQLGQSDFSKRPVSAHTTGTPPVGYITDREDKGHSNGSSSSSSVAAAGSSSSSSSSSANGRAEDRWSRQAPSLSQLLVIGFTAAGSVLLLINTSIAVCYVRRRRHRRHHRHHRHLPHRGSNRDRDCSHHPQHPQPEPHHQFSQLTVPPDLTSNPQQKNNMTVSHTSDAFGGIGDSGETPYIACVSTISMKTSDTFLRDDSENNLKNPSIANSSTYMVGSLLPSSFTASVSHPDRLVRSADYTCKQPQQHTLAGPVKNEDDTDCLSSIRHLSPPRLPHFLLQQPLLGSPPDLLDTMCPTGESGHHCLNDYRRDNKQLTPNRARQSLQMTSDAYDDKCASVSRRGRRSFVNRQFASLPRTSQTSLVTFARVENPATSAFTSGC